MDDQEANAPLPPDDKADESVLDNTQEPIEQGFTIDPNQVEQAVRDQMSPEQSQGLTRVLKEGNKLLFDEKSHYQLMDLIEGSKDLPGDLGIGTFSILMMLFKGGGYTMPDDIMQGVGTILLTRACAYISEAKLAPITDDDYEEAVHIFTTHLQSLDPKFKERMAQSLGGGEEQPEQPQPQQPQPSGILNQGVQ